MPTDHKRNTFTGSVKISIRVYKDTDKIVLHRQALNITPDLITVEPESSAGKGLRVVSSNYHHTLDMFHLTLDSPVQANSSYILNIPHYSGSILEHWKWNKQGLFQEQESYGTKPPRYGYSTFFQPASARQVFPCFDEPDMKATFIVRVERPAELKAYSNMALNITEQVSIDRHLDTFNESPLMSTYTLAITVNDYESYPRNESSRTRILVPEEELKNIEGVYEVANNALLEMEKYTGIPYPLSKLDHVGCADYRFEGMEHWGLIIYRRSSLQKMTTGQALDKERAVHVICHEVAHQWFGNLITMDWWSHFWLNEAFATFFQYYIADKMFTEWRLSDRFIIDELQGALRYDAEENVLALSNKNICNVKQDFQKLIESSYSRGSSILKMFEMILGGKERFQRVMKTILKKGMMKNVRPNDFFAAMEDEVQHRNKSHLPQGVSFKNIAVQWTEQKGFPLVTATRNYTSCTVHLKQERFHEKLILNDSTRWFIPLTWTSASSPPVDPLDGPQDWLNADKTVPLNIKAGDWFLLNTNATGYYRVNYDDENWSLLARALMTNPQQFSVANRIQLLNNVLALFKARRLDQRITLDMTRFLQNETDHVVWMSAAKLLDHLFFEYLLKGGDPDHSKKIYIHRLVTRAYDRVSVSQQPSGHQQSHLDRVLRKTLFDLAQRVRSKSAHLDSYILDLPEWLKGEQ